MDNSTMSVVTESVLEEVGSTDKFAPAHSIFRKRRARPRQPVKKSLNDLYQRYVAELIFRQKELPPSKDGRHIPLDLDREDALIDERRGHAYLPNTIRTSRYTVYDFLPKQVFFQLTRLANFYFLCVGVPQTIPGISTTGNYTTILPLLFFVLLTVVKEGYDDWKRHRLDTVENGQTAHVLRNVLRKTGLGDLSSQGRRGLLDSLKSKVWPRYKPFNVVWEDTDLIGYMWRSIEWKDLKVGDVIKVRRDEDVPADIVLLHANGENGLAYVETMALDGETNLKSKQVSTALEGCDTVQGLTECRAEFVVEDPNPDLYRFDGRVTVGDKTLPLTASEIIYRGCTLRNTPEAIGLVINTGEECKIRRNANRHPDAKKPALERKVNRIVITLACYVIILSVGCSMGYLIWQNSTEQKSWYIEDAPVKFQEIIIGYAIMFNNVIPLALYVSLEIVKIGQMLLLNWDVAMYDEVSDTPARCNTNTILENLGQIGYVFSDKTGTLTENVMKFRKLSIAGTSWLHEDDTNVDDDDAQNAEGLDERRFPGKEATVVEQSKPSNAFLSPTVVVTPAEPRKSTSSQRRSSSHWRSTGRPDHVQPDLTTMDLVRYIRTHPESHFSKRATQSILAMALCHTCLPELKDGKITFQAASPDELALVEAAQELGYLVVQRSSRSIVLQISHEDGTKSQQTYDILDVIEFSSKRKRMTIILRCPDGRIWLVSKGADSTIFPRLKTAKLALQKADEVRQSLEVERELQRRSEAWEPRNSFGGRPSLVIRSSLALSRAGTVSGPSKRPVPPIRTKSLEASTRMTQSEDRLRPQIAVRTVSFEVPTRRSAQLPRNVNSRPKLEKQSSYLEGASGLDDQEIFSRCFRHLDEFATEGLRTLVFAHKYLSEQEYRFWKRQFDDAQTSLVDRQERIEETGELIEQSLELIGASAIEDKLQKGVPETIDRLRRANIKIWMLTGDKRETAINIAHSARLCHPGSELFILDVTKGSLESQLVDIIEDLRLQADPNTGLAIPPHSVVVIDGQTLAAIEEPDADNLRQLFYMLIPTVDSVICCRASPAQKALLVRSIRSTAATPTKSIFSHRSKPLTLAIGDGANDLAMLAEAHVGIGISGREGLQAARVADYSIAQFRFLGRLLLVHGRWNYVRTARFIIATFWKEMYFYLPTALYQRYNGYTGTSLYESWSLTVLNTLFTSLCVVIPGIFEQDLSAETLLAVPELYVFGQRDQGLNMVKYMGWMVTAVMEGLLIWFACWAGYGAYSQERDQGLFALGNLVFSVAIMWTNTKLL
jgi:phospholipid-translocating ATPase